MRKTLFAICFLVFAAILCGAATPALAGWDFNNKIKHEDDGNVDHACATDFHLEIPVGASDVSEATAKATDPAQTRTGTVTYTGSGATRAARIDWTFDPCIDRGETVEFQVKAAGKACAPNEAYWTYATGRGGSILMAGIERDAGTGFILRNSTASQLVGEVRFVAVTTPMNIDLLDHGAIPGLGAPQFLNLPPGGSVALSAVAPSTYGHAVIFQITGQGSGPDLLLSGMQYIHVLESPGLTPLGLVALALMTLVAGLFLLRIRRRSEARLT